MRSCDVVQRVQRGVGGVAVLPVTIAEHAAVGVRGDDFADEEIVRCLVMRLIDHFAFEPAHATCDQMRGHLACGKCIDAERLELVRFAPAVAADLQRLFGDAARGNAQYEFPGLLDEFSGQGRFIDHHAYLGRCEIEAHVPRGGHHVLLAVVRAGYQYRRAMIDEAIGFGEFDGLDEIGAGDVHIVL